MKQGKGYKSFVKRTHWSQQTLFFNNTRDNFTHGHHQMINTKFRLITFFVAKDGEALYSQQKQDWELTVAQIITSLQQNSGLKKVGKTTRPVRYNLNQIPYEYAVAVTKRFKGLDLVNKTPEKLWTEVLEEH